jgi:thioredoxin 1
VLVDFYADWCGPCRMLAPILEELAQKTPSAKIVKVDIDHSPNVAYQYRIQAVPTLVVFKKGQVVAQQSGLVPKAHLKALLSR